MELRLELLQGEYAICRFGAEAEVPAWATRVPVFSVTRTGEELSVLCREDQVPASIDRESGWRCIKLVGPFSFELTGILDSVLRPLAERQIPILAVSTFDTDYVFIKEANLGAARDALTDKGHCFV